MTHLRAIPRTSTALTISDALARDPRAFTFAELVALSSHKRARGAVARGDAVRLAPDSYVAALHADSFAARADAALLWAGPNAALAGSAALFAWGLIDAPPTEIEIAVPHDERPYPPPWIRVRRLTYRPRTRRIGRATVLSPSLAIVLGFGGLARDSRGAMVFRAVTRGVASADELADELARVPRCRARKELMRRIDAAARGAESHLEEQGARTVFNTREFARFVRQHRVRVRGERFRIDMYDPGTMTAVELDGAAYHSSPYQRQRDVRRDAILASVGILTVRLTYEDITERPEWCRSMVRDVLRSRRLRASSSPQESTTSQKGR
ncbi:endonuclease domain-containing protein [Demequina lignilytica]|uniref:DUF559 domain-containing protein n=1 Tax=Demequina lignilytica TaxID=3051663 RepID=A0AB35MH78_9MICO|nr:DUF559 domain-containing protein [Demequina sp. SYSU T0a273]MDN4483144.1 DUF559 domain-containing protein [Demequina sp. SYSU T0a273]